MGRAQGFRQYVLGDGALRARTRSHRRSPRAASGWRLRARIFRLFRGPRSVKRRGTWLKPTPPHDERRGGDRHGTLLRVTKVRSEPIACFAALSLHWPWELFGPVSGHGKNAFVDGAP